MSLVTPWHRRAARSALLYVQLTKPRVIELLPEAEREGWHARLRPHLVKVMRDSGASTDFLTSSYMQVAGTAFSTMALELGLPPEHESVEKVPATKR